MLLSNLLFLCSAFITQQSLVYEKIVPFQVSIWSFVINRRLVHSL